MKYLLPLGLSLAFLSGCASVVDHSTQMMTIRTPGADNAKCYIENEAMKYVAYTDQQIEIMKSPHDLVVRCKADHNRARTVHVKRELNDWVIANVANGFVPGASYDYFSRGGFQYPEKITVDFRGAPKKAYETPEYFRTYESYSSGVVLTEDNKDSNAPLQKLDLDFQSDFGEMVETPAPASAPSSHYDPREEDK